jgi:hypothetical protein
MRRKATLSKLCDVSTLENVALRCVQIDVTVSDAQILPKKASLCDAAVVHRYLRRSATVIKISEVAILETVAKCCLPMDVAVSDANILQN